MLLEPHSLERATDALRRFLEFCPGPERKRAWQRMADLARRAKDQKGELHAWPEFAEDDSASLDDVSFAANKVNAILKTGMLDFEAEEKRVLVLRVIQAMERHLSEFDGTDFSVPQKNL